MLDFMDTRLASDADILQRIESFCHEHQIGVTTFGRAAVGDPNLVANMRQGRSLTLRTAGAVMKYMAEYQATPRTSPEAA